MRSFAGVALLAIVLLLVPLGWAGPAPTAGKAATGDLEIRLLPPEGSDRVRYVGTVAEPMQIRVALRNRGNEEVLVPLVLPLALRVHIHYEPAADAPILGLGGFTWGPEAKREALVSIAPGESHVETRTLTPLLSGPAHVVVELVSPYGRVAEYRGEDLGGAERRGRAAKVRHVVDEPRLWQGRLRVYAPLHVALGSHYARNHLEGLDRIDRIDAIAEIAVTDRSERAVEFLRQGLPPAFTRQGPDPVERLVRTTHLVVAARRGYGYRALSHLLRIVEDEAEEEHTRGVALEGSAIALDETFRAEEGDCAFRFRTPKPLRAYAIRIVGEVGRGTTPLSHRAREILANAAER